MALNLLWKPTGGFIRFIFALTSRGPIVLMCSDLQMPPVTAIELYCLRVRVETLFAMLKHLIGAFRYHFWSKGLPRHSRKPKKNQHLKQPTKEDVKQVQSCWEGCERFVMLAAIALCVATTVLVKSGPPRQLLAPRIVSTTRKPFRCGNGIPVSPQVSVGDDGAISSG